MRNRTITALEAVDSWERFERLSSSLLLPLYPDLNPIGGTADLGRDATARLFGAADPSGQRVVFQFSYEATWEAKLKRDLKKVQKNGLAISRYVFVTSRAVTGQKREYYEKWVPETFGWEFEAFDQEWFRVRLESPDYVRLRLEYLGLGPDTVPLFLSTDDFGRRQNRGALITQALPLIGRQEATDDLDTWLQGDVPILVLHAPGGSGKTRVAIEFARALEQLRSTWRPVFVRTGAEQFEVHIGELERDKAYVVIVDDAHRFEHLRHLPELLVNDALGSIKLLLITRSVFKNEVVQFAAGRYGVQEQALGRMRRADLDRLIRGEPYHLQDKAGRNAVLDIAQGSPLVAQAAAALAARGEELIGLTADDALRRRFDEVVLDALGPDNACGRDYLAVLAGLGGIDNYPHDLRAGVRAQLGLDESAEARILSRLIQAGIVQRGYSAVRIFPDVLADHLLTRWFLDGSTKQYDFSSFILEPFFQFKAQDILRNLAEAEYRGEAPEASTLLSSVLDDLVHLIHSAPNPLQLRILSIVRSLSAVRSDDALYLVAAVIDRQATQEADTESDGLEGWYVLSEAVHVLDETKWRRPIETLNYLLKLSRWGGPDRGSNFVRTQALKAISEMFEIKPRVPFGFYETALCQVENWIRDDSDAHALSADVLKSLLTVRMAWAELSPENQRTVTLGRSLLAPSPTLRRLRDRVFAALRELYARTSDMRVRKLVIDAHETLVVYDPSKPTPELQAFLNHDIRETIVFFNSRIDHGTDISERFEMWAWATRSRRHGGYRRVDLRNLILRLESDPLHVWYLNLAEYPGHYDAGSDWQAADARHQAFMADVVGQADEATIDELTDRLDLIITSAHRSKQPHDELIGRVLHQLGRTKPALAKRLLLHAADHRLEVRTLGAPALGGIREAEPELAYELASRWVGGSDPSLGMLVAQSYSWQDGARGDRDIALLETLAVGRDANIAVRIVRVLPTFQRVNHPRTIALLKQIASWAPEWVLHTVADVIGLPPGGADELGHIVEIETEDLRDIVWNFLRLQRLDGRSHSDVDQALRRLAHSDPISFLRFIRARLDQAASAAARDPDYDALPYEFHYAFQGLQQDPRYPDLLREVMSWVREADGKMNLTTMEAVRVLRQLTGGQLNDALSASLRQWFDGSVEEQRTAAHILREFAKAVRFFDMAKELLEHNDDDVVQAHLSDATFSTGTIAGSFIPFLQGRLNAYEAWLNDPGAGIRPKMFARRMIERLERRIEAEELREAEEDE